MPNRQTANPAQGSQAQMNLRILDLAEADLLSGFQFYERRSQGVGWYFLDTFSGKIESLHPYSGSHRKVLGFFRMLSRRFPYAIYYRIDGGENSGVANLGLQA